MRRRLEFGEMGVIYYKDPQHNDFKLFKELLSNESVELARTFSILIDMNNIYIIDIMNDYFRVLMYTDKIIDIIKNLECDEFRYSSYTNRTYNIGIHITVNKEKFINRIQLMHTHIKDIIQSRVIVDNATSIYEFSNKNYYNILVYFDSINIELKNNPELFYNICDDQFYFINRLAEDITYINGVDKDHKIKLSIHNENNIKLEFVKGK